MILTRTNGHAGRRVGAAVVELAMTLPVLLLILFGAYEFGRANLLHHATEAAAYEAARVGIVPGATGTEVRDAAQFVLSSVGAKGATITINPAQMNAPTDKVRVTIRLPLRRNTLFASFFSRNAEFVGQCELTREGT